ncbi:uncharacterized protein LOC141884492 isoform X2 [Acropora palmata]|uniref:uncharacterized protein LOC141884492 isoform X2 n=1 Tax=Acropora palmata TaxID=6131 RepID=UPI003DA0F917
MAAETEPANNGTVSEVATSRPESSQFGKVFNRLYEVPAVNVVCTKVSGLYVCTRNSVKPIQLGFAAAEVTVKTAVVTTQKVYSALPATGLIGKLKTGLETKVSQVDDLACDGIKLMQKTWPLVQEKKDQVVSLVTSVPLAGVNATKNAAKWSWSFAQGILQSLPLIGQKKEEPRRSTRKVKGNYRRMVNEADPFATSPDRKRKYQQGENEGALTEQLVYVNDDYVSEDDPDYVPDDDEESASTDDEEGSEHEVDEHGTKQQQTKSELKSPKKEQKQPTFDSNSQEKKAPQAKMVNGAEKEKNIKKTKEEIGKTEKGDEKKPSKEDSKPKTGVEEVKPSQEEEAKNKKGGEETQANKKDNAKTNKGQHGKEDYTTVKSLLNLKLY